MISKNLVRSVIFVFFLQAAGCVEAITRFLIAKNAEGRYEVLMLVPSGTDTDKDYDHDLLYCNEPSCDGGDGEINKTKITVQVNYCDKDKFEILKAFKDVVSSLNNSWLKITSMGNILTLPPVPTVNFVSETPPDNVITEFVDLMNSEGESSLKEILSPNLRDRFLVEFKKIPRTVIIPSSS